MSNSLKKYRLSKKEADFLDLLGYSKDEIETYTAVLKSGKHLNANQVATILQTVPSAIYRIFYELEKGGLLERTPNKPIAFVAVNPGIAFPRALENNRAKLEQALKSLSLGTSDKQSSEIIVGRQALYDRYIAEVKKTSNDIVANSIGIAYSEKMMKAHQKAVSRGVSIRYIFQQYKPANFHALKKWQDAGLKLRHAPSRRGFHLMIFDSKKAIVSFSNPLNTEDRISIITDNPTAVSMFKHYFEGLWLSCNDFKIP